MNPTRLYIPRSILTHTLTSLQAAGNRESEGVVLWLGSRRDTGIDVVEAYVPEHEAAEDFFRIPTEGMSALVQYLSDTATFVGAQVHSHPGRAYHSRADDEWAVVRHAGALSLVLPHFARRTDESSFIQHSALFTLTTDNKWVAVNEPMRSLVLTIV